MPVPAGWPTERDGYRLYPTPRGLIYATQPAAAGWLDRFLKDRLARVQQEFELSPGPGVFIAIGPDDLPMAGVTPWPVCRQSRKGAPGYVVEFPSGPPEALGFTPSDGSGYRWACALPTDGFNAASIDYSLFAMLREHPIYAMLVHGWFFLLCGPAARAYWLDMAQNERDRGLAISALGGADLSTEAREALRARIYNHHDEQRDVILRRYKGWLME